MPVVHLSPILLSLFSYQFFVLADVFTKQAGLAGLPVFQMTFIHSFVSASILLLYVVFSKNWHHLHVSNWKLVGLRSIISPFNLGCSFFALGLLPLHIFYTLVYLIPIYTALMAAVILKEKTDTRTWLAISAGLMGALIAIYGSADNTTYQVDMIGVIVALIGGILFACNQLITRKASASEHRLALAFYPLTFNIIFSSILCVIFFDDLKIGDPASGNMALTGLFGLSGLFCNLAALKKGRAAPVVAMIYSQLPTGAVLGYFLYQQTPKPETLMGAVIIILAGLYLIWHESRPRPISDNISTP